jgi:metal-responsive CopG/Arc/MetJ family transcriptional regulator
MVLYIPPSMVEEKYTGIMLDKKLLSDMDHFIKNNKPKYTTRSHLIRVAIFDFLKKGGEGDNGRNKIR